jgi:multiple sugar transport system substrate-binding protein
MTIRRRTLLISTAALAFGTLPLTSPAIAQGKTQLVIANSQWLDALRGDNLWAAMKEYEKVNPNVELVQEAVPSNDMPNRMMTEMGAGQGPDITIPQDETFFALAGAGFLLPLDSVVASAKGLNHTNDAAKIDGVQLGIAWQRAPYALIYNKKLLEKAGAKVPTTVDELIEQAKKVSEATGAIGFTGRHSMNEFVTWFKDYQNWAYGYGVNWVDGAGDFTIDTPEAAAAVDAFAKVYNAGIMPIGDQMTTQRMRFQEGQVAFSIDNSGGTLNIASGGSLPHEDLGAAPMPFENPGAHQQIFIAISKFSKNPDVAKDFVAWLVSPEGQKALRSASGPDMLATDVPLTDEFVAEFPWATVFSELAQHSRATVVPGYETETATVMRPVMEGVEKVLLGAATAKDALAAAEAEDNRKFKK